MLEGNIIAQRAMIMVKDKIAVAQDQFNKQWKTLKEENLAAHKSLDQQLKDNKEALANKLVESVFKN